MTIHNDDIRYYRETLTRYGYRPDEFGLAFSLDQAPELNDPMTFVHVTRRTTRVKRQYPASGGNTWLLNFEEELGGGVYNGTKGEADLGKE